MVCKGTARLLKVKGRFSGKGGDLKLGTDYIQCVYMNDLQLRISIASDWCHKR